MTLKSTLKLRPIDRQAALVVQKAPSHSTFQIKNRDKLVDSEFWEAPRPHKPIPDNTDFIDLTGSKVGRLTVIGFLGKSVWQCRCVCGRYCKRTKKFIEQVIDGRESTESMCRECYGVMLLKKQEYFKAHGCYPSDKKKMEL
ncbi:MULTISPECIES: hypothetical protein [Vibrio]|uniref:Uncharacterized protein n=1 Tax=Vibrio owensii CAIM 1854 = LMG 25443 TaxID=1229493 RepID=A0A0C1W3G8_9VIBR|nr:hypothetical protein [Vibrio owensii]KIF50952.1 hypothetical protein H735_21855 [Vibrio owensii CAIM 1854 = LMG 25443]